MCECKEPGFCPLHNMYKNKVLFDHCQRGEVVHLDGKVIQPPTFIVKVKNYIFSAVSHIMNGSPEVSEDVFKERISICEQCPLFNKNRTCNLCGCEIDIKAKWADVSCPDNPPRWNSIITQKACKSCK